MSSWRQVTWHGQNLGSYPEHKGVPLEGEEKRHGVTYLKKGCRSLWAAEERTCSGGWGIVGRRVGGC